MLVVGQSPLKGSVRHEVPYMDTRASPLFPFVKKHKGRLYGTHTVSCRYPRDDPKVFLAKHAKANRLRKKQGKEPLLTPEECCRPRLQETIAKFKNIITLGSLAKKAIVGPGALSDVLGGPTETTTYKVLSTYDTLTIKKSPKLQEYFDHDLAKAVRFFDGKSTWVEPEVLYNPSVEQAQKWLYDRQKDASGLLTLAYDVETDGIDVLSSGMRCLAFGTDTHAMVIPFISKEDPSVFFNQDGSMKAFLVDLFTNPKVQTVGWNSGYFDRMVIETLLGITPGNHIDAILLHRLCHTEYPHRLAFAGSQYTDAPAWKAEHAATDAETDMQLWLYNARDAVVTYIVWRQLYIKYAELYK